jgi:flagellar motility protein MotE (MotC chaperone)
VITISPSIMASDRAHATRQVIRWTAGLALVALVFAATAVSAGETAHDPAGTKEEPQIQGVVGAFQGPATTAPREIFEMLEQRKRVLDAREAALRAAETNLVELKAELELIVSRHEQLVEAEKKRNQAAKAKSTSVPDKSKDSKNAGGPRNVNQAQLAKIYETMPPEEAAARLERMPERKAMEVLRLIKGKSAGAILAEVKPERAARLTEQLLTTP